MKGRIRLIGNDGTFGFVEGENGVSYHFDLRSDQFLIGGAEVTFDPVDMSGNSRRYKRAKARNVKMVAVPTSTNAKKVVAAPPDQLPYSETTTLAERHGREFGRSYEEAFQRSRTYDMRSLYGSALFMRGYRSRVRN